MNTVRQGYCYTCLAIGGVISVGSLDLYTPFLNLFEGRKKHRLDISGPDFPVDVQTLTPECLGIKKFLPIIGPAGKQTFGRGRPRFRRGHP